MVALSAVAVCLVLAGVGWRFLGPQAPTPSSVVQGYFDRLAKGDASGALKLVARRSGSDFTAGPPSGAPLLVAQALSDRSVRPTDMKITEVGKFSEYLGNTSADLKVTYKVAGNLVTDTVEVWKTSDSKHPYLLLMPFWTLSVDGDYQRQVTVNGVLMDKDSLDEALVFPGAYTATAEGNLLLAAETQQAKLSGSSRTDLVVKVTFGEPKLASGAEAAVKEKVKARLDKCAQSTETSPDDCPFSTYIYGKNVTVKWSITQYPEIKVTATTSSWSGAPVTYDSTSYENAKAHYVASYTDSSGAAKTENGDEEFDVEGLANITGQEIAITMT